MDQSVNGYSALVLQREGERSSLAVCQSEKSTRGLSGTSPNNEARLIMCKERFHSRFLNLDARSTFVITSFHILTHSLAASASGEIARPSRAPQRTQLSDKRLLYSFCRRELRARVHCPTDERWPCVSFSWID